MNFKNSQFKDITNSDHSLLQVSLPTKNIIFTAPDLLRGKQRRKKIIELDKTSEKQWDKFKERIEKKIAENNLQKEIQDTLNQELATITNNTKIEDLWSSFENIIISSAFCCLHCIEKIENRTNNIYKSPKIKREKTKEFKQYRIATKILTKWRSNQNHLENNHLLTI